MVGESIVMSTSDPKSEEQNEKKQTIGSADSERGRQAGEAPLWKKFSKLIMRSIGQKPKGKPDGSSQGSPSTATEKLIASIESDLSYISEVAKELVDNYSEIITYHHRILQEVYDEIKKKNLEGDEKVAKLSDLSDDLMKLKLAVPQKYKGGAEKKDPKNLEFVSTSILGGGGASEMMPQLHRSQVFGVSMELKDLVGHYNILDRSVKLCLLCLSIFPRGAIIKKRLMVQWWVAEGYASTEDVASLYFDELVEKGFIEAVNDNKSLTVGSCRIHPFNRSALVALAERARLFNFGGGGEPTQNFSGCFQACLMGAGLISYDDFKERNEAAGKGENDPKKVIEGLINELERLHLLMNVDEHILEFVDEWFSKLKNLNILYLGRWKASASHHIEVEDAKFLKKLENFKHVKLISFQGVSNVIVLPDSILELRKLRVLDLRACYNLESIPERIGWALRMLTHLDMSECYLLSHMPKSLSQLTHLKVLKGFFAVDDCGNNYKGCTLDDLKKLKCLEKLCIYTKWKKFLVEGNVPDLEGLTKLTKLTITWGVSHTDNDNDNDNDADADKKRKPGGPDVPKKTKKDVPKKTEKVAKLPRTLRKLDLKCFPMSETPEWLKLKNLGHTQLNKLYIRGGEFSDLGQYQGIDEASEKQRAWKVEVLRLKYLGKIEMEWRRLHDLFPNLKYLEKVSCPKLTLFPCNANGVWIKPAQHPN